MLVIPRLDIVVQSKHRIYFHSALLEQCKIKDLSIIHNDSATAYDIYQDSNGQEWVYIIYYSKRSDLDSEVVEGWEKLKKFETFPRNK